MQSWIQAQTAPPGPRVSFARVGGGRGVAPPGLARIIADKDSESRILIYFPTSLNQAGREPKSELKYSIRAKLMQPRLLLPMETSQQVSKAAARCHATAKSPGRDAARGVRAAVLRTTQKPLEGA